MRCSLFIAAMLSTLAIPAMSMPIQQVYEREYDEVMAREPSYGFGTARLHIRPTAREPEPFAEHAPSTPAHITPLVAREPASAHAYRSLPEDELETRGWFSVIKDGAQGVEAIKSEHDSKKKNKKQGKRSEELEDLYGREFYDYDYY
ncbi:uncharacterized protein B0H18DRAFT_952265 [Fomitopsis serialis]|uniref:uncharacterized protein n=1 Tax=Fomitopsis serialis TaxID=139415 RepID=UPI002008A2E0|nr:uncharacterized protein B0H18DRAFT_952265 [Neoantrodia serialis]KAH9932538.1 hypothetical protein B0H18DRAFT_952265 [Neoantrodia serialis]